MRCLQSQGSIGTRTKSPATQAGPQLLLHQSHLLSTTGTGGQERDWGYLLLVSPPSSCNVPAAGSFLPLGRGGAEAGAAWLPWELATCKLRAFDLGSARGKDAPTRSVSYSINFQPCTLKAGWERPAAVTSFSCKGMGMLLVGVGAWR